MKSKKYEAIEHTADVMIRAHGKSIEELFANAAYGMFDQLADLSKVRPIESFKIDIEGGDPEQLLVDFLSELLCLFDTELVLLSDFDVSYDGEVLHVLAKGEKVDKKRHEMRKALKGVSYSMLEVSPEKGYAQILFDA